MRLVITRPQRDGERTAKALRALGHEAIVAPLLQVERIADARLGSGPWSGLLITSANAIDAIVKHPRFQELLSVPVFAVGRRSAETARQAGFATVMSADGNQDDLVGLVAAHTPQGGGLLYLAGEDRAGDLVGALAKLGRRVDLAIVYRAALLPWPDMMKAELARDAVDGVLHYSRRSADAFVAGGIEAGLIDRGLAIPHFCLSAEVAEPLRRAGARTVMVAQVPAESDLFALLAVG